MQQAVDSSGPCLDLSHQNNRQMHVAIADDIKREGEYIRGGIDAYNGTIAVYDRRDQHRHCQYNAARKIYPIEEQR